MKYGTPSGRIEECARCADRLEVDEAGRVPLHKRAHSWSNVGPDGTWVVTSRSPDDCPLSGRPSKQEKERRIAARAASLTGQAEAARDDAAVTLDAIIEHRTDPAAQLLIARLPEFRVLALHLYARRFKSRKKLRTTWRWERQGNQERRMTPRSRGDLYCRFCGELLQRDVMWGAAISKARRSGDHLDRCTLTFLAGMRDAAPATARVLPEEYRQDDVNA